MKKLVIVAIAVLLAMPVLSHAGSATSRWDLTIGGYIYATMGWADQEVGSGWKNAQRRTGVRENERNEFGNFYSHAETRPNFIIRGPDAWGAKTWARFEFDFAGAAGQVNGEGVLRHAFMVADWANDSILFGNTSYIWVDTGAGPPPGVTSLNAQPNAFVPSRAPQLRWTHRFGKNFSTAFGIEYPGLGGWMSSLNDNYNEYTRSQYPNFGGVVKFTSDACGKIGPNMLITGLAGTYGRKSYLRTTTGTARGTIYDLQQEDGWLAQAFLQIPIVPERNMNKAGAVLFYGNIMTGQGLSSYNSQVFTAAFLPSQYPTNAAYSGDYSTPKGYAYQLGLFVYLHDQVYLSGLMTEQYAQVSGAWRSTPANYDKVVRTTLYSLSLMYTPNPAITMGVEYTRLNTGYAAPGYTATTGNTYAYSKHGTLNTVRFGAYYWF